MIKFTMEFLLCKKTSCVKVGLPYITRFTIYDGCNKAAPTRPDTLKSMANNLKQNLKLPTGRYRPIITFSRCSRKTYNKEKTKLPPH